MSIFWSCKIPIFTAKDDLVPFPSLLKTSLWCTVKGDPGDSGCWHRCMTQLLDEIDRLEEPYSECLPKELVQPHCNDLFNNSTHSSSTIVLKTLQLNDLTTHDEGLDSLVVNQDTLDGVGSDDLVECRESPSSDDSPQTMGLRQSKRATAFKGSDRLKACRTS